MSGAATEKARKLGRYWPVAVLSAAAVGARLAWRHLLRRSLPPRYERLTFAYLERPVEILRDKWGIPHIYARQERDLFFAQGFVHAQDRLFQMEINRRVGQGRTSEIVGPPGIQTDRIARYFGWGKAIEAQIQGADERVRHVMEAYAAGVNTFVQTKPLPVEFNLLGFRPEPWGLGSTAALGALLAWGLSVNWETELLRLGLLEALGPEKARDLTPLAGDGYATILPDETVDAQLATALINAYHRALDILPVKTAASGHGGGSNNWVVSGAHTASGRPILANDPHLPPTSPALWYENHLVGGPYQVTGFTMPGVPGVIIGHNEHVAWGFTNAFPDIQDIYVERFQASDRTKVDVNGEWKDVELREEVIRVRGHKPLCEQVRYTRHGPVFSDMLPAAGRDLALRWAAYEPHNHLRAVLDMNVAANWREFRDALRSWGFPSQNIVYADTEGDIGYVMPGNVPVRRRGAGLAPVPGWNDEHEWVGWIPFEELPSLHNPVSGRIVTANNRVHGASYPYLLTSEWLPDYRARRIEALLENVSAQTVATHARIQADTVSLQARRFLSQALPKFGSIPANETNLCFAASLLMSWDGDMRAELIAPTIYSGWLAHFSQLAMRQAVGLDLAQTLFRMSPPETFQLDPFLEIAVDLSLAWLEHGAPDWVGEVRPLLLPALRKTIRLLEREFGDDPEDWLWGNVHQIVHEHLLTRLPGLGRAWQLKPLPASGDGYTVNQADVKPHFPPGTVEIIASCRMVLDVGHWDNSLTVLPGGQSGNPASPHHEDGLRAWRDGRYHPSLFTRPRIESAAESILLLSPAAPAKRSSMA